MEEATKFVAKYSKEKPNKEWTALNVLINSNNCLWQKITSRTEKHQGFKPSQTFVYQLL